MGHTSNTLLCARVCMNKVNKMWFSQSIKSSRWLSRSDRWFCQILHRESLHSDSSQSPWGPHWQPTCSASTRSGWRRHVPWSIARGSCRRWYQKVSNLLRSPWRLVATGHRSRVTYLAVLVHCNLSFSGCFFHGTVLAKQSSNHGNSPPGTVPSITLQGWDSTPKMKKE